MRGNLKRSFWRRFGLLGRAAYLWLRMIQVRLQERGGFWMIDMHCVIVIARHNRHRFISDWSAHAEQLEETRDADQYPITQRIAVLLHFKRLPFHNRTHRTLYTRFLSHNSMDLSRVAVPNR